MSLRSNYVMLLNELNVESILPVMLSECLLSQEEYMNLIRQKARNSERERREEILMIIPRKGKDFYRLFCECVVWSGQMELAQRMSYDITTVQDPNKYYGK